MGCCWGGHECWGSGAVKAPQGQRAVGRALCGPHGWSCAETQEAGQQSPESGPKEGARAPLAPQLLRPGTPVWPSWGGVLGGEAPSPRTSRSGTRPPIPWALISESRLSRSTGGPGYSVWLTRKSVRGTGGYRGTRKGVLEIGTHPPIFHRRNGGPLGARDSPGSHCEPSCWAQGPGLAPPIMVTRPESPLSSDRVSPLTCTPEDSGLAILS